MSKINYVKEIKATEIIFSIEDRSLDNKLSNIGAKKKIFSKKWSVFFSNKEEKIELIKKIITLNIAFQGGAHGWPPSEIVGDLRDQGKISGSWIEITWKSREMPIIRNK
jgi:hypothetical protein